MGKQKKHGAKKFEEYYGKLYQPSVKHSRRILEYTINEKFLNMHSRNGRGRCGSQRCNKSIKVGDRIVRFYPGTGNTRLFHKKCAQELNII